jgi:hypothetical protein
VDFAPSRKNFLLGFLAVVICTQLACEPAAKVRVYEAPKSESTFVSGPLAGLDTRASTPGSAASKTAPVASGPRRIVGAIIPTEQGCYFLKATEAPERLEPLLGDLRTVVETFSIDPQTGLPSNKLPEGWLMNQRNDVALAELISPESTGRVKFTVTALAMPPEQDWQGYLLSNVNRWRGQLKLGELTKETVEASLVSIPRPGSPLPSYLFDQTGTGTGAMSPPSTTPATTAPATTAPATTTPVTKAPSEPAPKDSTSSRRPTLQYDLPDGWTVGQGSQFRLATLNIESKEGRGEVTVSMATDNPQANTMMWLQQVAKESDPSKLEPLVEKTIQSAEKIAVGDKQAVLYEIRNSEQPTSPSLLVVSLPTDTPEMNLFIKVIGDKQLTEAQKNNLIQFVQSLKIK